jgi:hypothetical protein
MKTTHNIGYALLLLTLSLTLSSCFIFKKHKTQTKSTTDSTAYTELESTLLKKQQDAWKTYQHTVDTNTVTIDLDVDTGNTVVINPSTGNVEIKGKIKAVKQSGRKQATIIDTGSKQSVDSSALKGRNNTKVKKEEVKKDKTVDSKGLPWYVWMSAVVSLFILVLLVIDQFTLGGVTRFFKGLLKLK